MVNAPITVTVECYSGYTFAERPIAFVWNDRRYRVEQILKRWRSPQGPGFRVLTADNAQFELTYNTARDEWSLHLPPGNGTARPSPRPRPSAAGTPSVTIDADGEEPLSNHPD